MGSRKMMIRAALACLLIALAAGQEGTTSAVEPEEAAPEEVAAPAPVEPLAMTVQSATVRIEERNGAVAKEAALTPPAAVEERLRLDHTQTLKVGFTVTTQSGEPFRPQQAVVRLTSATSGAAAYFAATKNKDGSLSTAITSAGVEKQLGTQSGTFEAALLLGDSRAAVPLEWRLGQVSVLHPPLDDGSQPAGPPPRAQQALFRPKPEIVHQHRQPSPRAPAIVALAATAACVAPLGLLLVLLAGMKANFKGFPTGPGALWSLLFHGGLASILALYLLFWFKLNLMQTVPLVAVLGLATAGVGSRALSSLAQSRQKAA